MKIAKIKALKNGLILTKNNLGLVLFNVFVFVLLSLVTFWSFPYLHRSTTIGIIITELLSIVIWAIYTTGLYNLLLKLAFTGKAKISDLLYFFKHRECRFAVISIQVLTVLLYQLAYLTYSDNIIIILLFLILSFAMLILSFRFLFVYYEIINGESSPIRAFKNSFLLTRGSYFQLIFFILLCSLFFILLSGLLVLFIFLLSFIMVNITFSLFMYIIVYAIISSYLIFIIFIIWVATADVYKQLLANKKQEEVLPENINAKH